jgi:hypothetical protein
MAVLAAVAVLVAATLDVHLGIWSVRWLPPSKINAGNNFHL